MLQENTLFANRYQLIKLLGRGGFSEVWLAKDNWTHLQIAIKVYAPGQGMDQDGLQDFCRELASVYDLNHTNLLKPQHVDTWENMPYLIMAYCPSGSCVKRVGKMTEAELWKLIHDVAAGLAYLHEKDVIHQDIKPDNILIDTEGNYLITDFGISTRARSTLRKSVIGGNTSGGTTAYMGPERFSRQPAPTKASDIWSFGAMAFELLEGITPFGEIGGGMQKGGAEIPFINAPVSDALKYTIFKMLSKETWDRPTAATLVEWASNPSSIEIDYSLLSEEGSSAQAQSVPASVAETPTPQPEGRATQRFNSVEPMATIDYNSSLPEQEKEDEVKVVNKGKNKTTVIEKIIYILSCCYGMGLVALFLSEIEPILNSGTMYIIFYLCTLFVLLFNSVIALIEVNKKCDAKIKRRFTETSVVNLYSCGILVGLGVIGFGEYAFVCCLPMVIVNFILQLIKSKRIITSPNKDLDKNSVSEDQRQKGLFKKILMILSCVLIPLFSGIDGELTFVLSTICSAIALILYFRKCKKSSLVILALSIGIIFIPNHLMDSGYYASTIETQPVIETAQDAKCSTVQTQQTKTNITTQKPTTYVVNKNAIQAVDLGLSVKWASCNLGATKPYEYGYYYAWGETTPKGKYTWDTYQYCKGTEVSLTKYNSLAAYGKIDRKTVLEFSDDAVSTNLGSSWRIPTEREFSELLNNCIWKWTTINGVHGYTVTSRKQGYTNNSIFIPAAGYYDGTNFSNAESSYGNYWSSIVDKSAPNSVSYLAFHSSGMNLQKCGRQYGLSIRPVCSSNGQNNAKEVKTIQSSTTNISNSIDKISYADRKVLDASISNTKTILNSLAADAYMDRTSQKTEILNLLNQEHLPIVESELLKLKQVKSIQIVDYGIFEYSYFNCKFTQKDGNIYYKKTTGSQRQNGFLYRKDANTVYFAGAWSVNDDPTKEYGSDQSIVGIFYKLSSGKYIMIMGDDSGVNILLFK